MSRFAVPLLVVLASCPVVALASCPVVALASCPVVVLATAVGDRNFQEAGWLRRRIAQTLGQHVGVGRDEAC